VFAAVTGRLKLTWPGASRVRTANGGALLRLGARAPRDDIDVIYRERTAKCLPYT
jgi:hypothetical protein